MVRMVTADRTFLCFCEEEMKVFWLKLSRDEGVEAVKRRETCSRQAMGVETASWVGSEGGGGDKDNKDSCMIKLLLISLSW